MKRWSLARWATLASALMLTVYTFGKVAPFIVDHFLGFEYVDHYGTQWFYWFIEKHLVEGKSPGHTDLMFYPYGKDIFLHTGANVLDGYFAIPFRLIFGPVLGYNLFVLVGLVISALCFVKLAHEFTDDRLAVGVGSVLFCFSSFALAEMIEGRPTQGILAFPVLFLWMVWRTGTTPGWRWPALAGLFLALSGMQYWYYAFFGGMVCLAHGLWRTAFPVPGSGGHVRVLMRHAGIAAVALILTAPFAAPLALQSMGTDADVPGLLDTDRWDLYAVPPQTIENLNIGLFLWQPLRLMGGFFVLDQEGSERFLAHQPYTPLALFPLMLVWLWRPGRLHRGPVLAMLLMATIVAVGPFLLIGQIAVPNVLYIYTVKAVGFLRRLWWPSRMYAFISIVSACIVVASLAWFRVLGRRRQVALSLGVTAIWAWELHRMWLAPFPVWSASIPAGYACLAESDDKSPILELPYSWTQAHLYFQTVHERPIFGGMIENNPSFTPPETTTLREENTFVAALIELSEMNNPEIVWTEEDKSAFGALGYEYVVLQKDAFFVIGDSESLMDNVLKTRLRRMRKGFVRMMGPPVYEDARITIYSPFGAEPPCTFDEDIADRLPVGNTAIGDRIRIPEDPMAQLIMRVMTREDTGDTGDTGSTSAQDQLLPPVDVPTEFEERDEDDGLGGS